jgi:hypothetical protein
MGAENADQEPEQGELECREPSVEDLANLCRELNQRGAKYVVIGGFAIRAAGYIRSTMDVDLLIETGPENEALVFAALLTLPDKAIQELQPGEVANYGVVRVGDEIMVDLMKSACGINYAAATADVVWHEIAGVRIPFASPRLLWRMKVKTHRGKDIPDLIFLRRLIESRGEQVPD